MFERILGPNANAIVVATVRQVINVALIAIVGVLQTALNDDASLGSYGWAPFALVVLNLIWGVKDRLDPTRPG